MAAPDPAPQLFKDFLAPEGASTHAALVAFELSAALAPTVMVPPGGLA